jgi:hypothetical protein
MGERRKSVPKDPEDTKGGVRGTHGLGDAPRDPAKTRAVGTQGGTASPTGRPAKAERVMRGSRGETDRPEEDTDDTIDDELQAEHAYEHGLATRKTPGPGPKDHDAGTARAKDLDERKRRRK